MDKDYSQSDGNNHDNFQQFQEAASIDADPNSWQASLLPNPTNLSIPNATNAKAYSGNVQAFQNRWCNPSRSSFDSNEGNELLLQYAMPLTPTYNAVVARPSSIPTNTSINTINQSTKLQKQVKLRYRIQQWKNEQLQKVQELAQQRSSHAQPLPVALTATPESHSTSPNIEAADKLIFAQHSVPLAPIFNTVSAQVDFPMNSSSCVTDQPNEQPMMFAQSEQHHQQNQSPPQLVMIQSVLQEQHKLHLQQQEIQTYRAASEAFRLQRPAQFKRTVQSQRTMQCTVEKPERQQAECDSYQTKLRKLFRSGDWSKDEVYTLCDVHYSIF